MILVPSEGKLPHLDSYYVWFNIVRSLNILFKYSFTLCLLHMCPVNYSSFFVIICRAVLWDTRLLTQRVNYEELNWIIIFSCVSFIKHYDYYYYILLRLHTTTTTTTTYYYILLHTTYYYILLHTTYYYILHTTTYYILLLLLHTTTYYILLHTTYYYILLHTTTTTYYYYYYYYSHHQYN